VTKKNIKYELVGRRYGDLPEFWADASKAASVLNWHAKRSLSTMMEDAWRWQSKNLDGYHLMETLPTVS
jgi:UDP-glucose 4-epimerase